MAASSASMDGSGSEAAPDAHAALAAVRRASVGASVDARLAAAEEARLNGVDVMDAVATALEAPGSAGPKKRSGEPHSSAASPTKRQKVELTPREQAQLRLIASVPQLAVSRDARGRRRGVCVDMSEHLSQLVTSELSAGLVDSVRTEEGAEESTPPPGPSSRCDEKMRTDEGEG